MEAIGGWDDSVNGVNLFLNTANNLSGQDLTNAEFAALRFANAEPGFLTTLQGTPGLSQAGQNAANTLGQVFPAVPQNLVELTQSEISVQDALSNINGIRYAYLDAPDVILLTDISNSCPQILGNIGTLWVESAAAAGADTPGFPLGPDACPKPNGNSGDAFN